MQAHLGSTTDNQVEQRREDKVDYRRYVRRDEVPPIWIDRRLVDGCHHHGLGPQAISTA